MEYGKDGWMDQVHGIGETTDDGQQMTFHHLLEDPAITKEHEDGEYRHGHDIGRI